MLVTTTAMMMILMQTLVAHDVFSFVCCVLLWIHLLSSSVSFIMKEKTILDVTRIQIVT